MMDYKAKIDRKIDEMIDRFDKDHPLKESFTRGEVKEISLGILMQAGKTIHIMSLLLNKEGGSDGKNQE